MFKKMLVSICTIQYFSANTARKGKSEKDYGLVLPVRMERDIRMIYLISSLLELQKNFSSGLSTA